LTHPLPQVVLTRPNNDSMFSKFPFNARHVTVSSIGHLYLEN
jgi:hypothetical protein